VEKSDGRGVKASSGSELCEIIKMKLMTIWGSYSDAVGIDEIVSRLKDGEHLKFVPHPYADINKDEIVLVVATGTLRNEHEDIEDAVHTKTKEVGLKHIGTGNQGGGRIKIEGNKLIFFDSSNKFGPYNKELMQKVPGQVYLKTFEVESVEFRN